jgi:hypothetical protein
MRIEMIECDLAKCAKSSPTQTDGFTTTWFDGRIYDFCSIEHQTKWEDELRKLDPNRKPSKAKAQR